MKQYVNGWTRESLDKFLIEMYSFNFPVLEKEDGNGGIIRVLEKGDVLDIAKSPAGEYRFRINSELALIWNTEKTA